MALLNPPEIVPGIIQMIFHYVTLRRDGVPEIELEKTISPTEVCPGGPPNFKGSLEAGIEVGLFERVKDEIRLKPVAEGEPVRRILRLKILASELNENLMSDRGASDLTRALSWFLVQDLFRGIEPWTSPGERGVQKLQAMQFSETRAFQNDTRWQSFVRWAPALGFCTFLPGKKGSILVGDPTQAVIEEVDDVFGNDDRLPIDEFVTRLSQLLPVLDRGSYRTQTEAMLTSGRTDPHVISTSLSHCLRRLHARGVLTLQSMADAPKILFLGSDGQREPVSHVNFNRSHSIIQREGSG
jgi:hypothetical protein